MEEEGVAGQVIDILLQVLEVADTHYFAPCGRLLDHEVAEAEVAPHGAAQLLRQSGARLVDEDAVEVADFVLVLYLAALHDYRYVGVVFPHIPGEFQPGLAVFAPLAGEADVGDYAEHTVRVSVV